MNSKQKEQLLDAIGNVDERYIQEYIDAQDRPLRTGRLKMRLTAALAAVLVLLFGTVSLSAAVPAIGHFLTSFANESRSVLLNFDEIESKYAVRIDDTQECRQVTGTLNSAVVEDHQLLLSYTFDWGGLDEAKDGSFHTYFLPWFFYITQGDNVICQSEYTSGLHTQTYPDDTGENFTKSTQIYCIDLEDIDGKDLVGQELTVRLLYEKDGEGFVSTFTPTSCFTDKSWQIDKTYTFDGHTIRLEQVQESALYVTLFIDCDTIGHPEDDYTFVLSDELGNDYTVYPYEDNDANGYWFTKPEAMGTHLTLKVIQSGMETNPYGEVTDDQYKVLYEIPIELETSLWNRFF